MLVSIAELSDVHIAVDIMAKDIMYGHGGYYGGGYYGPSQAVPAGTPCREAAKLAFPTDRKARHAFRHECKQAWKAQKKAA